MSHQQDGWQYGNASDTNSNLLANLLYGNAAQNHQLYQQGGVGGRGSMQQSPPQQVQPTVAPTKKEKSMFKEITSDVRGFILEHRSIIYFLVFALLIDHLIFRGVFKARLESMVDKMVAKVEDKIK